MPQVTSKDGTRIDYDQRGDGPPVILIDGALQHRAIDPSTEVLADILARTMSVMHYDRRGRGESGDTSPYAVAREIEDIEALIAAAGGGAVRLYGMSSGAVLAIEAASALAARVGKLAAYEPPIDVEQSAEESWAAVREQEGFAARNDGSGAVAAFIRSTGAPAEAVEAMQQAPDWAGFARVGHTLAYDLRLLAEATDGGLPQRWQQARMPALIIDGDASFPFMGAGADAVARALPDARRRTLAGQTHEVEAAVLGPVLAEFFGR